jgi:hypothetical protein
MSSEKNDTPSALSRFVDDYCMPDQIHAIGRMGGVVIGFKMVDGRPVKCPTYLSFANPGELHPGGIYACQTDKSTQLMVNGPVGLTEGIVVRAMYYKGQVPASVVPRVI